MGDSGAIQNLKLNIMIENFSDLFEQTYKTVPMRNGALVDATVVGITNDYVLVNAGMKSDSLIPKSEFIDEQGEFKVQIGDVLKVVLVQFDNEGETVLSRESAKRSEVWEKLESIQESKQTVVGIITGKVKGGFTVEISGVRAFLPGSLIDLRSMRDPSSLEGKSYEFKVIKLDRKRNNIVISRRAVLEEENSAERAATLEGLQESQVLKGTVKNLTDYGAFIELGGIDGLLHKTDMSWSRVNHPSECLQVGDEVTVIVLKIDRDRGRVSLGMKQLAQDPWVGLAQEFPKGSKILGKVTNITDYGCFVEIKKGVEGLVHQSEMDWTNKNIPPSKIVQVGQDVQVMVLEIDEERRRISLGIKQCISNPWEDFVSKHKKGEVISGVIKSITDFGIFVGLDGDIDGLVHTSDISWTVPGEVAIRDYKKGQQISAVILAMDAERERISLGIKQLQEDGFSGFAEANPKGSVVKGKVVEIDAKAAKVELATDVFGTLRASEISASEKVADARNVLKEGDEVEAKITNLDRKNRTIALSIKALEAQNEAELTKEYSRKAEGSGATLGDLLKEQMGNASKDEE